MHKKLYKAKKNWVIALIAGSALLFGSATGVNADTNTQNQTNDNETQSQVANNPQDGQNETPEEIAEAIDNARRAENVVVIDPIRKPNTQNQTNNNGTQSQANKDNSQVNSTVSSTITPSNKKTNSSQNESGIEGTSVSANKSKNNRKDTEATSTQTTGTTTGVKTAMGTNASQNVDNSKNTGTLTSSVSVNNSSITSSTSSDISKNNNQKNANTNSNTQQETNETNPKEKLEEIDDDNEYPKKATIVGDENAYILSDYEYSDVSPKNIAIPKKNKTTVSKDNDTEPGQPHVIPKILAHYNNHVGLHQMLFSKTIKRRGQQYTVGLATAPGNQTFITYVKDKNGEVIGERSGIEDENIYGEDGRYYGASYFGNANVEWGDNTAIAFGKAEFSNGDPLGQLPLIYQHYGKILNTQIKVHMQDNGVLNYQVIWSRNTKEQLAFLKSQPNEQPFAFSLGKLVEKMNNSWFDSTTASPIVKLNDNLYCNYIVLDGDTDTPHYVIQFIKVDYPTTRVASIRDNKDDYSPNTLMTSRKIPGVASFMPKHSTSYDGGIEVYSPVSDKNLLGKHDNLAVIAFENNQTQRTLDFQRVFLNSQELSGLSSEQILPYVYDLFDGKGGTDNDKRSTTTIIYEDINGKEVGKPITLPNSNKKYIDITKLNKELSKKIYKVKDSKSGETVAGHYEISDLSPYKNTVPAGKTSIVRVDFIVDFDLKKATEDYTVDQAVDAAVDKIGDLLSQGLVESLSEEVESSSKDPLKLLKKLKQYLKEKLHVSDPDESLSSLINQVFVAPNLDQDKQLKLGLSSFFRALLFQDELDNKEVNNLRSEIKSLKENMIHKVKEIMDLHNDFQDFINTFGGNYLKPYRNRNKSIDDYDKSFDQLGDLAKLVPVYGSMGATLIHSNAVVGETLQGITGAITEDAYVIKHGLTMENAAQRYEKFSEEWEISNDANLQGWKTAKAGGSVLVSREMPIFKRSHPNAVAFIKKHSSLFKGIKKTTKNSKDAIKNSGMLSVGYILGATILAGLTAGALALGAIHFNGWSDKKQAEGAKAAYGVQVDNPIDKIPKGRTTMSETEEGNSINGGHAGGDTKESK